MFDYNNQVTLSQQQQIRDALARNLKVQAQSAETREAVKKPKAPWYEWGRTPQEAAALDKSTVQDRMQANGPMLDLGGIKQNANKNQDQSMRPHFDPPEMKGETRPADGGHNPMMGPATPEQSMMEKIMAYKPEGHMSRLFQAGGIIGDPLYGTTGKTLGASYNDLAPEYAKKDDMKLAREQMNALADKDAQEKAGRMRSQLEQARQSLERKVITPQQFTRMKTQIEGGADLKDVFAAMPDAPGKGKGDSQAVMQKKQRYATANAQLKAIEKLEADPDFNPAGYLAPLAQNPMTKDAMNFTKNLLVGMGFASAGTSMDKVNAYQRETGAWLAQILRDDSGAAVPESEHKRYLSMYIPTLGEGKEAIAGKAALRRRVTESLGAVIGMNDEQLRNVIDEGVMQELMKANPNHSKEQLFDMAVQLSVLKKGAQGEFIRDPNKQSGNITVINYDANGNMVEGKQ